MAEHDSGGGDIATWQIVVAILALGALASYMYVRGKEIQKLPVSPSPTVQQATPAPSINSNYYF